MTSTSGSGASRAALQLRGIVAVVALLAVSGLCYGSYVGAFGDAVAVELKTPRSGLLLEPGADVALRNVTVGKVVSVEAVPDGARISLEIDSGTAADLDPSSPVRIVSPSLLGPKYVDIGAARRGPAQGLEDGDELAAGEVQIEANAAFEHLVSVLDGIQPAQLNTALGAVAMTLEGRGRQLGEYLVQANAYFERFNQVLPVLEEDLVLASEVSRAYASLAPQLLAVLDAATTTSHTLVDKSEALDSLISSLRTTSDTTRGFLANNRVPLRQAVELLRPSTTTLARYAPMFPCLFASLNDYRKSVEPASGGVYPGLWVHLSVLPGADGYQAPTELPRVAADRADCSGGPMGTAGHYRPPGYDDGSPSLDNTDAPITPQDRAPLAVQLFGGNARNATDEGTD